MKNINDIARNLQRKGHTSLAKELKATALMVYVAPPKSIKVGEFDFKITSEDSSSVYYANKKLSTVRILVSEGRELIKIELSSMS